MCIASADRYTEYKYFCNVTHALRRGVFIFTKINQYHLCRKKLFIISILMLCTYGCCE